MTNKQTVIQNTQTIEQTKRHKKADTDTTEDRQTDRQINGKTDEKRGSDRERAFICQTH